VIAEISHFKDEDEKVLPDEERTPLAYNMQDIRNQLEEQMQMHNSLEQGIPDYTKVGMYLVNCRNVKNKFKDKHKNVAEKLKNMVYMIIKWNNNEVRKFKDKIMKSLSHLPTEIRELNELRK